jgi:prepilin-type processing-associated H-X9-DG protein
MNSASFLDTHTRLCEPSQPLISTLPCRATIRCKGAGFTLIDLAVVVSTAALLASLLVLTLGAARPDTAAWQCQNNLKQLGAAWQMYAADQNDNLPPNRDGGDIQGWQGLTANWSQRVPYSKLSWAGGWEDFNAGNTDNTNVYNLWFGAIGPYHINNTKIYHCPADKYPVRFGTANVLRLRSYSMNAFVGDRQNDRTTGVNDWYVNYKQYIKTSSLTRPGPANTWLLVDEHPDSINDGWFIPEVTDTSRFVDLPASYHNDGCGLVFCDGHSEVHKWHGPTIHRVLTIQYNGFTGDPEDIAWLAERSSVRVK